MPAPGCFISGEGECEGEHPPPTLKDFTLPRKGRNPPTHTLRQNGYEPGLLVTYFGLVMFYLFVGPETNTQKLEPCRSRAQRFGGKAPPKLMHHDVPSFVYLILDSLFPFNVGDAHAAPSRLYILPYLLNMCGHDAACLFLVTYGCGSVRALRSASPRLVRPHSCTSNA